MKTGWFKPFVRTELTQIQFDYGMLVFRVLVSASMVNTHGIKKILHFKETVAHIPDPIGLGGEFSTYLAIIANVLCPILVALGLFTRLACLPILSVTLMGFFVVHASDPWALKDIPLMYSLVYLFILSMGPGHISLDRRILTKPQ